MKDTTNKFIAELLGTMVLVIFGCGAAVIAGDSLGVLGIAFAFGLVIVAMAYVIGPISGCHINPAVSISMLVNKRMSVTEFAYYVLAQFIGATIGAGILLYVVKAQGLDGSNLGQNGFGNLTAANAFLVEIILTFVFVLAIIGVTGKKGDSQLAGLVIGFSLVLVHILGINLTGTSVNPARSFGPAIFVGGEALTQLWVFILAPLVGGVLAAVVGKVFFKTEAE